jgi:hypothetical protein
VIGVTLDTNIYVSALEFGGVNARLLGLARAGAFRIDVSDAILDELVSVLRDDFKCGPLGCTLYESRWRNNALLYLGMLEPNFCSGSACRYYGMDRLVELLGEVKKLAKEYYHLTGKPLGVTGEVAEFEAARLLGIQLCVARQSGYDAIRSSPDGQIRLSIKSACFPASLEAKWRIGTVDLKKEWDATVMVLLTPDFEPREIWEADRAALTKLFKDGGRTDPSVTKFKSVAKMMWPRNPN